MRSLPMVVACILHRTECLRQCQTNVLVMQNGDHMGCEVTELNNALLSATVP
jgi:hypothetical protein